MKEKNEPLVYCPICESPTKAKIIFRKNRFEIYSCPSCLLKFVYPQPAIDELHKIYSKEYFLRGNKYSQTTDIQTDTPEYQNDLKKINLVKKYKSDGRILDVGCALGGFLHLAKQEGYSVSGVEVSESSANHASKRLGVEVHCCDLLSAKLPSGHYDIITMWDVIEHLKSPHDTLSEINRLLGPNGILIFSTGDAGSFLAKLTGKYWHLMTPPEHLFFYNNDNLNKLCQSHGFCIKEVMRLGKRASFGFILLKARNVMGPIIAPIQFLVKTLKLDRNELYINLGDIMTCIASKESFR